MAESNLFFSLYLAQGQYLKQDRKWIYKEKGCNQQWWFTSTQLNTRNKQ